MNEEERPLTLLGILSLSFFIGSMVSMRWEWSFLMDDVAYLRDLTHGQNLVYAFAAQIRDYWIDGRFYPVKYLANLLKWRYLPLNPNVFHAFNAMVLFGSLGLAWQSIRRYMQDRYLLLPGLLFVAGFGILQRPLLDVVALNSIAEGWVILFLALGLCFYPQRTWAYRCAFLLCSLSKEPAIAVWVASAAVHTIHYFRETPRRTSWLVQAAIDSCIFVALALIIKKAQLSGSYTSGYRLISSDHIQLITLGLVKSAVGLLPLLALLGNSRSRPIFFGQGNPTLTYFRIFNLIFGGLYLFLVVGRGSVAGYLLIPPTFALLLICASLIFEIGEKKSISTNEWIRFGSIFFVCLIISMLRFCRYANAINESTRAFQDLLLTSEQRLVLINGEEATELGQSLADQIRAPVQVKMYLNDSQAIQLIRAYHGHVVLFELSSYFSRYTPDTIKTLGAAAGGWKATVDRKVCRIFSS